MIRNYNTKQEFVKEYIILKNLVACENNANVGDIISNQLRNKIIYTFENTIKMNNHFSKFIKNNELSLFDIELLALNDLKTDNSFDVKYVFENTTLRIFKNTEYDFLKRIITSSNIIKYSLIDNVDKNLKYRPFEHQQIIIQKKVKQDNSLEQLDNLLILLETINDKEYDRFENFDKEIKKYLLTITKRFISKSVKQNKQLKLLTEKYNLTVNEILLLMNKTNDVLGKYNNYKEELLNKYFKIMNFQESNLVKFKLMKEDIRTWNISYELSRKGLKLITGEEYNEKDKELDNELFSDNSELLTIEKPIESFNDVILSKDIKNKIMSAISQEKNQDLIFNKWGLKQSISYGKGITIGFSGVPGTGKTLTARAIANYLNKKLLTINYNELQNMYVGGTEKNISEAFKKAEETNAVLFFDEADAIAQNRQNATKSWEISQINVLLKELEKFKGVCIFSTNFKNNYDPAFERRLTTNIKFTFPEFEDRIKIFERHFKNKSALHEDVNFKQLAKFPFNGGIIKNIILNAARLAAEDKKNKEKVIKMNHFNLSILSHCEKFDENKDVCYFG